MLFNCSICIIVSFLFGKRFPLNLIKREYLRKREKERKKPQNQESNFDSNFEDLFFHLFSLNELLIEGALGMSEKEREEEEEEERGKEKIPSVRKRKRERKKKKKENLFIGKFLFTNFTICLGLVIFLGITITDFLRF